MSRGAVFALILSLFPALSPAQSSNSSDTARMSDAREYMEVVEKLKESPVDKQIEGWRQFLLDHPDTSFRSEIEANIRNLETMRTETDPVRRQEMRDTEKYLRAVEFSKKLSIGDQILLWQQFLEENPKTLYKKEVTATLENLKARGGAAPPSMPKESVGGPRKAEPIASNLPYLDAQKATLLATFPGLIVPGMGHWYTKDYPVASILTALRVGAVAFGIPGIVQENSTMIIAASVIYGFTYLVDAIDAPFSAQRYNDRLDQGEEGLRFPGDPSSKLFAGLTYTFHF